MLKNRNSENKGFLFQRKIIPKQSLGFTLIELLITITIIALLSAIGLVAYANVSRQGRDSKRKADLLEIQSALEQYYSDQGFYPTTSGLDGSLVTATPMPAFTNLIGNPASPPPVSKNYINALPQDPNVTPRYKYEATPTTPCDNVATTGGIKCSSYCLYTHLENPPSPVPPAPTGCSYPSGGYNFALTPP